MSFKSPGIEESKKNIRKTSLKYAPKEIKKFSLDKLTDEKINESEELDEKETEEEKIKKENLIKNQNEKEIQENYTKLLVDTRSR